MRYVLGGAEAYGGRSIDAVHRGMVERQGLRERHFGLVVQVGLAGLARVGSRQGAGALCTGG